SSTPGPATPSLPDALPILTAAAAGVEPKSEPPAGAAADSDTALLKFSARLLLASKARTVMVNGLPDTTSWAPVTARLEAVTAKRSEEDATERQAVRHTVCR